MAYFDEIKQVLNKFKSVKLKQEEFEKVYMQLIDILKVETLPESEQCAIIAAMAKVENDLKLLEKDIENITIEIKKL